MHFMEPSFSLFKTSYAQVVTAFSVVSGARRETNISTDRVVTVDFTRLLVVDAPTTWLFDDLTILF